MGPRCPLNRREKHDVSLNIQAIPPWLVGDARDSCRNIPAVLEPVCLPWPQWTAVVRDDHLIVATPVDQHRVLWHLEFGDNPRPAASLVEQIEHAGMNAGDLPLDNRTDFASPFAFSERRPVGPL